jgi:hypothetical protein
VASVYICKVNVQHVAPRQLAVCLPGGGNHLCSSTRVPVCLPAAFQLAPPVPPPARHCEAFALYKLSVCRGGADAHVSWAAAVRQKKVWSWW